MRINLKVLGCLAAIGASTALVAPAVGTAAKKRKTYDVSFTVAGRQTGPLTAEGKVTGKPWGTGKYKVSYKGATGSVTLIYKAGTVKFTEKVRQEGDFYVAKITFTSGTGRFKGIKGTGTSKSPLAGPYKYKAKVKY